MEFNGSTLYPVGVGEDVYEESGGQIYNEEGCYTSFEEGYGEGEYRETRTILADGGHRFGVSAVCFDKQEELLWMGNQGGHVTSYYGPDLQKYTSFQVHVNEEIRDISTFDGGILALTPSTLRVQIRRGIPVYTHTSSNLMEMQSLLQWSPTNALLCGHQPFLVDFDFNTAQETQVIPIGDNGCAILRGHSRFICGADPVGRVMLMDPINMCIEHTIDTHSGSLCDMDIHSNLLVTCGFSQHAGGLAVDRFLMVYDLRMLRLVNPIPVVVDPLLLRFLPSFSSRLAVVSSLGQMQLVETAALNEADLCLYQMNTSSSPLALDVSASCQFISIGDGSGEIHLFSSNAASANFNSFSRETEFADPVESIPSIAIDDLETPLPQLPYIPGMSLASDWPERFCKPAYRPTPPIDSEILSSMKMQGPIGYAPNPMTRLRNQVAYFQLKLRGKDKGSNGRPVQDLSNVPKKYRWVDLKQSKGDADFEPFNKTNFCGIAATLPNNYCNPMLQLLYCLDPVRCLALKHLCAKEFCLCCELGFLFDMMDKTKKAPCYANNFLRAFRTVPEASALGLILNDRSAESRKRQKLVRLIQDWNRFILHQLHSELIDSQRSSDGTADAKAKDEEDTEVSALFGMKQLKINRCLKCATDITKETTLLLSNLTYPGISKFGGKKEETFCSILERSLCPEQTTSAWCDKCNKFRPTLILKRIQALPHILAINCGMENASDKAFWTSQGDVEDKTGAATESGADVSSSKPCRYGQNCTRSNCRFFHVSKSGASEKVSQTTANSPSPSQPWLPIHIQVDRLSNGSISIKRQACESASATEVANSVERKVFDLVGVVCDVGDSQEKKNLVAFVKVGPTYHMRVGKGPISLWYLFNNFCVSNVSEHEVTWFPDWKFPCVLYWMERNLPEHFTPSQIPNPITLDVFQDDKSIARYRGHKLITFTPLGLGEIPTKGDLVAMDAEFVTLNQEEAELRSDGRISTVKPSHMSVARITCVRGQGPLKGTPFMDDYISTQEQVFDYLTKFSGIQPGDLDANFSSKHLTTLKSSYLKLRFLVDSGVKFVGHGLKNDIRVINISVPPDQLIDTVLLFRIPHERLISLRFLAWHFLGIKIQSHTHDSIEDARAALGLYFLYKDFEKDGSLPMVLQKLYRLGQSLNWKVPDDENDDSNAMPEWENSDED